MRLRDVPDRWVMPLLVTGWVITMICVVILTTIAVWAIHNCPG